MNIRFLGQGLNRSGGSVGGLLMDSFSDTAFNKFICLVAFASPAGVRGLASSITAAKSHIANFSVMVGVDQKGTSKEALDALLGLDINTSVYYTRSHVIFHPKIYIFTGMSKCRIIVGSSNLTKPGLFQNTEASLIVDFTRSDADGKVVLNQVQGYFGALFKPGDSNVHKLDQRLIDDFSRAGIVPSEAERARSHESKPTTDGNGNDALERIKSLFPSIRVQQPPASFGVHGTPTGGQPTTSTPATPTMIHPPQIPPTPQTPTTPTVTHRGSLVWRIPNLKGSHVERPPSPTGNRKGEISLTEAKFMVGGRVIEKTTYFRYDVFGGFQWNQITAKTEAADVLFDVTIMGNNIGQHRLTVSHKPSGEADQDNYTTAIRWKPIADTIRNSNLIGKELSIYAPKPGDNEPFYIEIR